MPKSRVYLLLSALLGSNDPLLDNSSGQLGVSVGGNASIAPESLLPDNSLLLGDSIDVRLLVVLPVVLSPGDLPWVALPAPHSESLAGFESNHVLVNADMEPAVAWVELVACETINLGLVGHESRKASQTQSIFSQYKPNKMSS